MKLTGKSLEQFEKWYVEVFLKHGNDIVKNYYGFIVSDNFGKRHDSEKYGVLVDFFDSVGIYIEVLKNSREEIGWFFYINDKEPESINWIESRPQARTKAIEKANDLNNNRV